MRKVWLLASAVLAFLNFVKSQEVARTLYSARYDNLDIDTILGSNRLVSNYVDCLLSRKPCPPEGKDLKRILPEALRTKCARCSPIQKENALKIITRLYFDYPDQYRALRERWDPSGEYHRRFEDYLRGLQFNQIGGNGATNGGQAPSGGDNGNTVVENGGGNDRPVRNDLDRQPASQSSNVQAVVIDPTLSSGGVNTLLVNPPPPPAPATERPRPPAPVAQILFPTTSVTSDTRTTTATPSTTTSTTTTTTTTTTSATITTTTSTSNFGSVELTSGMAGVPNTSNTAPSTSTIISRFGGSDDVSSSPEPATSVSTGTDQDSVVPAPVLLPAALPSTATDNGVVQSLHPNATSHEVPPGSDLPAEAPLRQQNSAQPTPPGQQQSGAITDGSVSVQLASTIPTVAFIAGQNLALPVVDGLSMDQNRGNVPPQLTSAFDVSATTGALPSPASSITDRVLNELTTAPPLVVVNRFGEDAATVRPPPVQTVPTTTTQRTTTTVRQTSPVTRQSTTRNTQRTTTRFITRVPPTPPPTPPRTTPTTTTTTTTTTILPPRPPPPPPSRPLPPPAQQQPLLPQAPQQPPQQAYPTIFYERPQAPPPRATAPPPPPPPIYVPEPAPTPYGTTPDSIIDHFFVPPSSQAANSPLPPSPIVGLWNQLGTKIADTADAIAGMLQKTVDVLVTSHIQSHQRALRRT